jgi:dolichyl-phosphate beta-glucosyltransferase
LKTHLVIPHYNDSTRLESFLDAMQRGLPERFSILVSDDGSSPRERERLTALIRAVQQKQPDSGPVFLDPLFISRNTGKGGAVLRGWDHSGDADLLAFADADGAVSAAEILRAEVFFRLPEAAPADALFASRVKMLGRTVERSLKRHLSGRVFATLVSIVGRVPAYDTQCGLKILRHSAFEKIRPRQQSLGFAFDVELCLLLRKFGCPIIEFPVDWTDIPGSKVSLLRDSARMAREVFKIRHRVDGLNSNPEKLTTEDSTARRGRCKEEQLKVGLKGEGAGATESKSTEA